MRAGMTLNFAIQKLASLKGRLGEMPVVKKFPYFRWKSGRDVSDVEWMLDARSGKTGIPNRAHRRVRDSNLASSLHIDQVLANAAENLVIHRLVIDDRQIDLYAHSHGKVA